LPLGEIRYFDSIGSTNDYAVSWIQYGPPHLSVVIANEQTAGRGRTGRQWLTPPGAALAFSVILHPDQLDSSSLSLVNGLGALAVSEALIRVGLSPQIKWPNDVLINGLKVAGVLPESHWIGDQLHGVVLGIGVNVGRAAIPPVGSVNFPAGCVEDALGRSVAREALLREMLSALIFWVGQMETPIFLQTWEKRLAFQNEQVKVIPPIGEPVEGSSPG
jgi:BirA family biotin operon repressor/biotin-[acetyl-CoA-carboxylase] ligase